MLIGSLLDVCGHGLVIVGYIVLIIAHIIHIVHGWPR